ncbi:hypothetical protein KHU12_07695, partial [Pseudocitrobacter faecalis]
MPNSEVKRRSADGSVGSPHARVGNCQALNKAEGHPKGWPFCVSAKKPAGCGYALSGLHKNNPTEWHGSAAGQLRANTARTTPLWHSLNDTCPEYDI